MTDLSIIFNDPPLLHFHQVFLHRAPVHARPVRNRPDRWHLVVLAIVIHGIQPDLFHELRIFVLHNGLLETLSLTVCQRFNHTWKRSARQAGAVHFCNKQVYTRLRNAILSHFGVFFFFSRTLFQSGPSWPGDTERGALRVWCLHSLQSRLQIAACLFYCAAEDGRKRYT